MLEPIVFYIGIDRLCLFVCFFFFCGLDGGCSGLNSPCVVASASLVVYFWFVSLSYAWFLFWASPLIDISFEVLMKNSSYILKSC